MHEQSTRDDLKLRLSPLLSLFREAVIQDRELQDQLRGSGSCQEVAEIANAYISKNVHVELSRPLADSPLAKAVEENVHLMLHISVAELEEHMLYQTNAQGEVLLGESEMALVAGGSGLAAETSCYGCSCTSTCIAAKTC
jgi:hypothetical protein